MADKNLTVQVGALYMLRWTVPDTSVVNKFVNPDGTSEDFPDPDPPKAGETASVVEIRVKAKRKGDASAKPDPFKKNRTPPIVAKTTVDAPGGAKRRAKVYSAIFKARDEGEFEFEVSVPSEQKSITQKMTVIAAKKKYRTIQEVIDDPKAVRRQAVLAAIADFFPAFNTGAPNLAIGVDSGHVDQGAWIAEYVFPLPQVATSCTTVNPRMMNTSSPAKNDEIRWSFNAGPEGDVDKNNKPKKGGGNKAWVPCDKDNVPSVGDTYIVLNKYKAPTFGHVGIVLEVPPSGNGLWITADGGQGSKKDGQQIAIIVPRWGLMGAMLPLGGHPQGQYPEMKPEDDAGPFLGSGMVGDVHPNDKVPVPARHDDVPGITKKIIYKVSQGAAGVSNPRRMHGFVDVDSDKLKFAVDGQPTNAAHIAKCKVLQTKVEKVIAAYLSGRTIGTSGT